MREIEGILDLDGLLKGLLECGHDIFGALRPGRLALLELIDQVLGDTIEPGEFSGPLADALLEVLLQLSPGKRPGDSFTIFAHSREFIIFDSLDKGEEALLGISKSLVQVCEIFA